MHSSQQTPESAQGPEKHSTRPRHTGRITLANLPSTWVTSHRGQQPASHRWNSQVSRRLRGMLSDSPLTSQKHILHAARRLILYPSPVPSKNKIKSILPKGGRLAVSGLLSPAGRKAGSWATPRPAAVISTPVAAGTKRRVQTGRRWDHRPSWLKSHGEKNENKARSKRCWRPSAGRRPNMKQRYRRSFLIFQQ